MYKKKICVVLPSYKVRNTILKVYKKLKKIKKISLLIFVDDSCPQKSVSFLKSQIKKDKKVIFIFLKKNLGVGGATLKGIELANKMKFDIITKFDADNQHRINDLKAVIKKLLRDDIYFCKGYRILTFKASLKRKMPLVRIIGASALTYMSNLTTGNFSVRDVTNGLLGLNSKILKIINFKSLKKNYFFEQDLIFRVSRKKIKIHQIKAEVIYNDEISSLNTLKSVIPFFIYHIQNFLKKSSD
jgi:dolichol-phosphate mannosyltransferase